MASVLIGSARGDENGKASGGRAGDQTGKEVSTQNWYLHSKGWVVLRPKDAGQAAKIARCMKAACANDKIGYDQGQRNTLYTAAAKVGFDCAKVDVLCETDCSALTRVCAAYAGITAKDYTTDTQVAALMATGAFDKLTGSKYTESSAYLRAGDILVTKTKGHTVVVLTDGPKAYDGETIPADPTKDPPKPVKGVRITGGLVNLRTGPGTGYRIVRTAKAGEVFETVEPGKWNPIKVGGEVLWVSGDLSEEV